MRIQLTRFAPAIALGAFLTVSALAQEDTAPTFSAEQLIERTLHRRAIEAMILGDAGGQRRVDV